MGYLPQIGVMTPARNPLTITRLSNKITEISLESFIDLKSLTKKCLFPSRTIILVNAHNPILSNDIPGLHLKIRFHVAGKLRDELFVVRIISEGVLFKPHLRLSKQIFNSVFESGVEEFRGTGPEILNDGVNLV